MRAALLAATAAVIAPALATAQTTGPTGAQADATAPVATDDAAASDQGDIIVTGTSVARRALDTPLAVTTFDSRRLQQASTVSQADVLNQIPTIKADGGGGEVAANVFVRGLPSSGQYQFTPLEYDGVPVMSTFGLNSSAFDVYFRNDLGIERLEFVRGGVSNLFGPGSVAGLINYISKTGGDQMHGTGQFEWAERGRYRGDAAISGPLGGGLFYALSGYYRTDEGPIRTGLETEGYQVRGNLKYEFPDGNGSVTLYGQYIDDQAQFYLPIPLDGRTRNRLPGNDGNTVYQVMNDNVGGLRFNTPDGVYTNRITDGVTSKGGQVALAFDRKFGDVLGINGRLKYSRYAHRFGLWSDGDGVINVPETLQSFLTNRNLGSTANARFTYADTGAAVPANYLLFANRFTDRNRPMEDYTGELNLTAAVTTGAIDHAFTLGGFYAKAKARDFNATITYLGEFNNEARLVGLTITNPTTGAQTIISNGGLLNAGAGYVNNFHEAQRYAGYFADQMKIGDRFNLDLGVRFEQFDGSIRRERTATFVTDTTTPNLSTALRDVIWGNDLFLTGKPKTNEWAAAAGGLYKLTDRVSLYANGSRGFFFPEIRSVTFNALGQPASYSAEIIKQAEAGIKVAQPWFNFAVSGFYTKLDNRRQVNFVNDSSGGFTEQVNLVATESWGAEGEIDIRIIGALRFNGNLTLQHARYTQFQQNGASSPALIGRDVERQPSLLYNAGLYYDDDTFDLALFTNYTGDNFTAANNAILLEGWNVANLNAGVKVRPLGDDRTIRLGINVFNLFDTQATTEGSPRQDTNQSAGGAYFVGRPVLPRRISARASFSF
jgi:outer membrane receptor protein involved in Fe transport